MQVTAFHNLLREKPYFMFILLGWSSVCIVAMIQSTCPCGFFGKDTGVLQLDVMTQIYIVFCHGRLLQMVEMVTSFNPGPGYVWFIQYS
jgi:hypothetical protein